MEKSFVKPLKIVVLISLGLCVIHQADAAKPPLPQYNEIGSFMAQSKSSNNVPNDVKNTIPVNANTTLNMSVPSYHSPYSQVPVSPKVQHVPSSTVQKTSAVLQPNLSVDSTSQSKVLEPVVLNGVSSDSSASQTLDSEVSKSKKSLKTRGINSLKTSYLSFRGMIKSIKFKDNLEFKKKNKSVDKKQQVNSVDSPQTVFEPDNDSVVESIYTTNLKQESVVPTNKPPIQVQVRKSVVPTPSFADTMIFNNVQQVSALNTSNNSSKHPENISVQNISISPNNTISKKTTNEVSTHRFKQANIFRTFTSSEEKTIDNRDAVSFNSQKEERRFLSKFKKDVPTDSQPSQDKLDAFEEIRDYAKVLYNANKINEAIVEFNNIPDINKISDDWLFLANIAQDNNKLDDAIFYLKKAIQLDDNNYKAHYNLGNIYLLQNKTNSAISEYKKVNKIKKDFAYAYYNKGCCYLKTNNYFNARYEFGLAIKYNPEDPVFYYNLAYTNKMMKKEKKAKEALEMYNKLMNE